MPFSTRPFEASQALAPFAVPNWPLQGRRHPEPSHPYRTDFQRDRDRVLHAKAFRRLERKTQVFAPHYSDHFRNRLTHTIEVSQISRTIGWALGLNTDLCEVLALSHDIGHPPFGHEGERILNGIMQDYGAGFDHNLHALRIVEDFEQKYADFRGLNLTFEVREGIVKHSRDYPVDFECYIELSEYRLGERPPLEAQLIDLADEIAYNSADLDDGYHSGLITLEQMLEGVTLVRDIYEELRRRYPDASEKLLVRMLVGRLIDVLVSDLVASTRAALEKDEIRSLEQVRQSRFRRIVFSDETARLNRQLKDFLHKNLYSHPIVQMGRESAGDLLRSLFQFFEERPGDLPPSQYRRLESLPIHWVVCDYVAGMTDSFAEATHARVLGGASTSSVESD